MTVNGQCHVCGLPRHEWKHDGLAAHPTAASTDALRAALKRMLKGADTETRYWMENILAEEGAALASSPPPTEGLDVKRVAAVLDEAAEKGWNRGDTARVLVARLSSPEGHDR